MLLVPTVKSEHASPMAFPVGAGGAVTFIVIYSLHVTPLVVTSTQYSVVSVGVTEMVAVMSPVDQV